MSGLRVLFVGLGPLGRMIVSDFIDRGLGEVAGAVDIDPSFGGKGLGEVLGRPGARGRVYASVGAALAEIDPRSVSAAVVATSSELERCMPTLRELLSAGVNVVSTCEELLFPWLRSPGLARELEGLCAAHGSRCVGTGVNPGYLMDTLPVALSAVCREVRAVRVERYQDASTRRVPFQKKIGASLSEAEFARRVADKTLRHVGLGESLHFIDRALKLGVVRWNETIEPVRATRALTCALGAIPAGGISGVRQTAHGFNAGGREVITLEFQAAIGQEQARDRVVLDADPPIESIVPGAVHGDVATSAITLNCIPRLLAAGAGLHTMSSLPLVFCAAKGS